MHYLQLLIPISAACLFTTNLLAEQPTSADHTLARMKADAAQIRTHALDLEKLAKDPNAQWAQFDRQWNEIKPAEEALVAQLRRLDAMRASLTDPQRTALDQSKQAIQTIALRTRELIHQIDQQGSNLESPRFRTEVQSLASSAGTVMRAA